MTLRLTHINLSLCRILLFTLIFSLLVATNVFAGDQLPSGHAKLLDWDETHQGFSFEYRSPAESKMDFFIADRGEESVIHAFDAPGVIDMGSIPLDQVKTAPEEGYKNTVRPLQGHSYVLRSRGVYAKIYLQEIFSPSDYPNLTVTEYEFDWVIQPDGTRDFGGGGSSASSQVGTKEALGKVLDATASELNWKGTSTTMPWRDFESVFWTGIVENRSVTMGIIIHDSEKLANEDLKLFGESGYGYSPSKFKSYSAFISKTAGKANGIYWRMGQFILYVNDPISEDHLYEVANVLYSRANSSPIISESEMEKERDSEGEKVEDKTVEITPTADGQVYAYSYRNWNRANRGKWDRMKAGWNPVGGESRAYLKFDVSQLASTGQVILKLYQKKVQRDGGAPLGIYRVTSKWREGDGTYVSGRQSPTADPGELSWEQQPTYEEQPVIIFRAPSEGLLQIEITPLVRQWQSGVPNHGLMIRPAAYQPSRKNAHIFTTKEWKEPQKRPRLVGTVDEKVGTQTKSQSSSGDNGTAIGDAAVDLDGDGIDDSIDQCPDTPLGAKVDSKGCEITDKVLIERDRFQLESGRITLTHEWKEVSFAKPFNYPVIVAKPLSYNGTDPATVAIKDVTSEGFKVRIQEWTYIEGNHTEETLSYLVVERGHFTLDSGLEIEADVISTDVTGASKETTSQGAQYVNFFSGFSTNPVVFGARNSFNGEHTVATRIDKVTREGFNVLMQEQESNEQSHVHENISYIALSEGTTRIGEETLVVRRVKVNHEPYTINLPSGMKVKVRVVEEQSVDEETDHSEESVGYLSFPGRPLLFIADT